MQKQSWTVGLLCYNEVKTIRDVAEKALRNLELIASEYELIIVDDGSKDGSTEVIKELAAQYKQVVPVIHPTNKGIGMGINSFYRHVRYENVFLTAGDGQFDLDELLPFAYVAPDSFISFYRKENTVYSFYRNWLSWVNKKMNEYLLGIKIKDVNWSKIIKHHHLKQLDLQLESSLVETEVCSKLLYLGVRVTEVQSKYLPRIYGVSKGSSFSTVIKAFKDIWILIGVMYKFKRKNKRGAAALQ